MGSQKTPVTQWLKLSKVRSRSDTLMKSKLKKDSYGDSGKRPKEANIERGKEHESNTRSWEGPRKASAIKEEGHKPRVFGGGHLAS